MCAFFCMRVYVHTCSRVHVGVKYNKRSNNKIRAVSPGKQQTQFPSEDAKGRGAKIRPRGGMRASDRNNTM